jgi:actin related protein 2/3 complex subunit 1A/1B
MPQVFLGDSRFGKSPISDHVWNKDRTRLAAPLADIGKVGVYKVAPGPANKVTLEATLGEHTGKVTGIDWCPVTNQIATCSADRNAFVWIEEEGKWKPTLVLLRINRACTCIHWSPNGDKFAVGTGSRVIAVCYLDKVNNFWVSKHIKKPIRSTITCLDWHPNNVLLLAGGTDFKVRLFSALVTDVETKPDAASWAATAGAACWGPLKPFGNMLAEFDTDGWVHSVAFHHSGSKAAAVTHGSTLALLSPQHGVVTSLWHKLPFKCVRWVADNKVVCGGHDFTPELFTLTGDGTFQHTGSLDALSAGSTAEGDRPGKVSTGAANARDFFINQVDKGGMAAGSGQLLKSAHKNVITSFRYVAGNKSTATKVSSGSLDGKVIVWDVKA